jgi:peroxiredoxin
MTRSAVIALLCTSLFGTAAELPRKATDFAIQTGPEKYIWLSDYPGKTVVMAFILTTCPHCQFTTGLLNKIHKEYADKGVVVFESAIEPMSSLHIPDFVKNFGVTFPVGYNEQNYAGKFLGREENEPMFMPQVVIIDPKGMIRAQFGGDDLTFSEAIQETTLREKLDEIVNGQAAPKPPARPSAPKATKAP